VLLRGAVRAASFCSEKSQGPIVQWLGRHRRVLFRLSLGPVHCTSYAFKTHAAGEEVGELDRCSNKFSRRWILSHRPCYECLVRLGRRMGAGSLARASRRPASCSLVERNKHWKDGGDDLAKRSTSLRESCQLRFWIAW